MSGRWDDKRFGVERECTCKRGNRSAECHQRAWHLVDTQADRGAAIGSAMECVALSSAGYRVIDVVTDEVILPTVRGTAALASEVR